LDCYGGIDHGKAISLPANVGEDSTRMHSPTKQKEEQSKCLVISRTLH
jgi:hypothetical protein